MTKFKNSKIQKFKKCKFANLHKFKKRKKTNRKKTNVSVFSFNSTHTTQTTPLPSSFALHKQSHLPFSHFHLSSPSSKKYSPSVGTPLWPIPHQFTKLTISPRLQAKTSSNAAIHTHTHPGGWWDNFPSPPVWTDVHCVDMEWGGNCSSPT